ncbi:aldehyde dehydrogenase [Sphingomonas profundi]|uniref:aldehyde dehydrogenase n=1 Tax=Alterirhizorhabdus profundi TaxID=2681549 RepID=UPI0012E942DB|nr:aldehyde dehydrogenase [Sphingomonas profundi]
MTRGFTIAHPDHLYIGGSWVTPSSGRRLKVVNPADESVVMEVAAAAPADVDRAVTAARAAFDHGPWPRLTPPERAVRLRLLGDAMRRRQSEFAAALTTEMGSPISVSTATVAGPPALIDFYATLAETLPEIEERDRRQGTAYGVMEPVGVVAAVVPWNAPLNLAILKLAPALAAGCTIILKPAPTTPLNALLIAECLDEVGLPEGVVSVLPADNDVSDRLIADPRVDKVTFTGSTGVGRHIARICADRLARVALELGGKSAAIILDDMDIEDAVRRLVPGSTMVSGQACSALTRVLVPPHRRDAFVEAFAAALRQMRVGDPQDPATQLGPIALERQRDRVLDYVAIGRAEGARLVTGGGRPANLPRGFFVAPTLFDGVDNSMRIAREEIFGPVVSVIAYRDEEDAIAIANDSDYGLYASIFTHDDDAVWRLGRRLRTGNVGKNGVIIDRTLPYGGFKQSGIGREGGIEGLRSFQEQKMVYLA